MAINRFELITRLRVRPGRLEELKVRAAEAVQQAARKDVGIIRFEWFLGRDGKACEVREAFSDPDAFLLHRANVDWSFQRIVNDLAEEATMAGYAGPSLQAQRLADSLGPAVVWFSLFRDLATPDVGPAETRSGQPSAAT